MIKRNDNLYWNSRYKEGNIGWDIGTVSRPLKEYIDQIEDKSKSILIPGAGNAYEAEYLFQQGFTNITVVDISKVAIELFLNRVPNFAPTKVIEKDFYEITEKFDLVLEQTFFCALPKTHRQDYAEKMSNILNKGGKLVGVLFNIPLFEDHPPFGGSKNEYEGYFKAFFNFKTFEICNNSIPEREGNELFINLELKSK